MDQLVAEGVPDFKLFTAYPGVFYSDDGAIFRAMQQTAQERRADHDARRERAGDRRRRRRRRSPTARPTPTTTASPATRSSRARRRTASSASPRRPACPVYIVHLSAPRRARRGPRRARPRHAGVRRDVPAVPVPVARRHGQRLRGREVRLLAAAAPEGPLGRALDRPRQGRPAGRLDRPLPVRLPRPEGPRPGRLPEGPERPARRRGPGRPAARRRRRRRAGSRASAGSRSSRRRRRKLFGLYPRKGAIAVGVGRRPRRLRPGPRRARSRAKTHHMDVDYSCYEGREVQGALGRRPVAAARSIVRDGDVHGRARATAGS